MLLPAQTFIVSVAVCVFAKGQGFYPFLFQSLDTINIFLMEILSMSDDKHKISQAKDNFSGGKKLYLVCTYTHK